MSNPAWSIAVLPLDHVGQPLLAAIAASSLRTLSAATMQRLPNPAWSVAAIKFLDVPLRNALSAASIRLRTESHRCEVRSLCSATILWAFSFSEFLDHPFLDALSAQALRILRQWSPSDIAQTAWAVAALCVDVRRPLLDAISASARATLRADMSFEAQHLNNLAWSFAVWRLTDPPLRNALAAAALAPIRHQ